MGEGTGQTILSKFRLINSNQDLQNYLDNLGDAKTRIIALDTESNNHRHAYGQQLCLIQIYDGDECVAIDPNSINDKTLRNLFENRDILKIMYDAPSDISLLVNTRDMTIKSILDLRPGVDLLEYEKKDLYSVIFTELGIELGHKKKFHQYNWLRRPLSQEALEYAINDVRYLFRLKDIIIRKVYERQLFDIFFLRNIRVQNRDYFNDPHDAYRRVKGYNALSNEAQNRFQQLHAVREKYAKQVNMPSANIIGNSLLLNIASNIQTLPDIKFPKRLPEGLKERILRDLQQAIKG